MKTIKVSDLISQLEKIKEEKGDLDVIMCVFRKINTHFVSIDTVDVDDIHPDDVANEDCRRTGLEGTSNECVTCIVLS